VSACRRLTAEEYWPQEELKAEKDYLFLTSVVIKHKLVISSFTGTGPDIYLLKAIKVRITVQD
jgi:hypothetical protein